MTLEQFLEYSKIDREQGAYHFNTEALSILADVSIDTLEDMDIDELNELVKAHSWCTSEPSKRYKTELLGMTLKPFNKLCLFEYIDLDYFVTDNYLHNLDKICAILFKRTKENEWGEIVMEPYEYDLNNRAELFLDLPITDVYGIITDFLKFRENFLKTYENLFSGEADEPLTDEERANLDAEDIKEIEAEEKSAKWSWELMIYNLCNGDVTKTSKVGELSLTYVFNILGMKKELDR